MLLHNERNVFLQVSAKTYKGTPILYVLETHSNVRMRYMYSTQGDKERLQSFERKILRKVYGPMYNNDLGSYKRKSNVNLHQLYNKPSLRNFLARKR